MKILHIIIGLLLIAIGAYMEVQFSAIKPAVVSGIGFMITGIFVLIQTRN